MPKQNPIIIAPPAVEDRGALCRVTFPVRGLEPDALWFDVSAKFRHFIDDGCDAALMALLGLAMGTGRPVRVEGPVSARLLWGLRHTVLPVSQRVIETLDVIDVQADELRSDDVPRGDAVLTGLSCGVDSFSLLRDHLIDPDRLPGFGVTHFLFAHIGHHGYGGETDERAEERWQKARSAARELGRPILRVSSNTPSFYPGRYDHALRWAAVLTLRMASVPLLLQRGVRRYLVASSHALEEVRVAPNPHLTVVDPIILPALSTEYVEMYPVGAEHSRVEKTERIADWDIVRRHLDVCIMEGSNCGRCAKCMRTLSTLEVLGRLRGFGHLFDLDAYEARRTDYFAHVLVDDEDDLVVEIRTLIRARGFSVPAAARARAVALRAWRLLPGKVRTGVRRLPRAAVV